MAGTSTRMLQLMSLLQTSRHWSGQDLAVRMEVSLRTVRRDIERLRELGYPVQATRGVDGGYQLRPGASLPPLVLDDDEAVALALGLQAATYSAVEGMAESSVRALAKVVTVMPRRLRRRVEAITAATARSPWPTTGPVVDPTLLTTIASACRDAERCTLSYEAGDGRRLDRRVEPHRLVPLGRRWYLLAYDLERADWRTFRMDRVERVTGCDERFAPRDLPGGDAVAFVRASTSGQAWSSFTVVARIHAPVELVTARIGRWATVTELAEGLCRMEMQADGAEWPLLALGVVGADFEIESPAELRAHLHDWAARFSRAAGAGV